MQIWIYYNGKRYNSTKYEEIPMKDKKINIRQWTCIAAGLVIVLIILPIFGDNVAAKLPKPEALPAVLATARTTFSVTQLITALIGSVLSYVIWLPLKKYLKAEQN